jgi:hypothetical protein
MRLGCVVRTKSTRQDSTTGLWTSLARGMRLGHSLREVPVAGTCEMRRSRGGVSLWDEALGQRCRRGTGRWLALKEMSYLVPLRTGMSREPDHMTLRTHHLSLVGRGTDVDLLGRCHYC